MLSGASSAAVDGPVQLFLRLGCSLVPWCFLPRMEKSVSATCFDRGISAPKTDQPTVAQVTYISDKEFTGTQHPRFR